MIDNLRIRLTEFIQSKLDTEFKETVERINSKKNKPKPFDKDTMFASIVIPKSIEDELPFIEGTVYSIVLKVISKAYDAKSIELKELIIEEVPKKLVKEFHIEVNDAAQDITEGILVKFIFKINR